MKTKSKSKSIIIKVAVIIGVVIIPLLYSYFYLHAFWDPYANLQDVPFAVVNLDEGADINGTNRNVGDEICKNLKEDGSFKFIFTDEKDAQSGVLGSKYYAEIVIPKDFSANIATASQDTEKVQSTIKYYANQKRNYLASQIAGYAVPKIKESVNSSINGEIVGTLSNNINSVPSQLKTLDNGLGQLSDGATKLGNGVSALTSGAGKLSDGASQLKAGTQQLQNNAPALSKGVSDLNSGAKKLVNGLNLISANNSTLTSGASQVSDGVNTLINKTTTSTALIVGGLSQLGTNIGDDSTANTLQNGAKQIKDGTALLNSKIEAAANNDKNVVLTDEQTATIKAQGAKGAENYADSFASGIVGALSQKISSNSQAAGTQAGETASSTVLQSADAQKMVQAIAYTYMTQYSYPQDQAVAAAQQAVKALASGVASQTAVNTVNTIASQVSASASDVSTALKPNLSALGGGLAVQTANGVVLQVNAGLKDQFSAMANSTKTLAKGASDLYTGVTKLNAGVNGFKEQVVSQTTDPKNLSDMTKLSAGAKLLSDGVTLYTSKVGEAGSGAKLLSDGTAKLSSNIPALVNGVSALNSGAGKLSSGLDTFKSGTTALSSGVTQLSNGLTQAKDGVEDSITTTNAKLGALNGLEEFVSNDPVTSSTTYIQPVANYGSAFAPYFMGLSMWVGGLMIFFGIYLDYNNQIPALTKASKKYMKRAFSFLGIGTMQALLLACVIKFVLGVDVAHIGLLLLACVITSLTFISIIQFFIVHLGDIGKFLALLMLILQLTSCAGMFPIETNPSFFQKLCPFMPMTYSTKLFKEAISGTWSTEANKDIIVLVSIAVVFTFLTMFISGIKLRKEMKENNLSVEDIKKQMA